MMLAMTTMAELYDSPMRHELGVMSGGHSGLRPPFRVCPSYLLVAPLVSGEVRMAEGDAAASVGWTVGVGSPLLHTDVVPDVAVPPWTPHREARLETHRSSILAGSVPPAMLAIAPLTAPMAATKNQATG